MMKNKRNQKTESSRVLLTGLACVLGGLLFAINYATLEWLLGPLESRLAPEAAALASSAFWIVTSLSFAVGSFALAVHNETGARRQKALGFLSALVALMAAAFYVVGAVYVVVFAVECCASFIREAVIHF